MNAIHYIGLDVHKKTISLLHKDGRRPNCGRGQAAGEAAALRRWAEGLREPWHGAMEATLFSAWIYDTLKPYAEQLVDGPSGQDEGHHRGQEEKRYHRCAYHRRLAALQPVACLLCVVAGDARSATAAALSQPGGPAIGAHAEQDGGSADGERNRFPQGASCTGRNISPS